MIIIRNAVTIINKSESVQVEEILKADINVNVTDEDGYTPLMAAANFPNEIIVNLLLNKGAEVNAKNNENKTGHCRKKSNTGAVP